MLHNSKNLIILFQPQNNLTNLPKPAPITLPLKLIHSLHYPTSFSGQNHLLINLMDQSKQSDLKD